MYFQHCISDWNQRFWFENLQPNPNGYFWISETKYRKYEDPEAEQRRYQTSSHEFTNIK